MKVFTSKSQLKNICKLSQIQPTLNPFDVYDLIKEEGPDDKNFSLTLNVSDGDYSYEVEAEMEFDFEPAQHGGRTDPSWPDHFPYLGSSIITITPISNLQDEEGNLTSKQPTEIEKEQIIECVQKYCEEQSDSYSEKLLDIRQDSYDQAKIDRYEDRNNYAKNTKKITVSISQWNSLSKKAQWLPQDPSNFSDKDLGPIYDPDEEEIALQGEDDPIDPNAEYKEGFEAGTDSKTFPHISTSDNPYRVDTEEGKQKFDKWLQGFNDAINSQQDKLSHNLQKIKMAMVDYNNIPPLTLQSLQRVEQEVKKGNKNAIKQVGSFLSAVFRNDLYEAVIRADPDNIKVIKDITAYFQNKIKPLL